MSERKMVRIVEVGDIIPIAKADAIEVAKVGGWSAVVKKGVHQKGSKAVYFEIDTFLPEGNPAWQFLVDTHATDFEGQRGHALRTVRLRGQISQGLLMSFSELGLHPDEALSPGFDLAAKLGARKYEEALSPEMIKVARGMLPTEVPRTKQERIQNMESEFSDWQNQGAKGNLTWELTEKLEGASCTFAWMKGDLHACSHRIDYHPADSNEFWQAARSLDIEAKLRAEFGNRSIALQGELVGPGMEQNVYGLESRQFMLYEVVDLDAGRKFTPVERRALCAKLGIPHVPVIATGYSLSPDQPMEALLLAADAESVFAPGFRREGVVYKCEQDPEISFKAISNDYLISGARIQAPKAKKKNKP